jgi:hypothetical protein
VVEGRKLIHELVEPDHPVPTAIEGQGASSLERVASLREPRPSWLDKDWQQCGLGQCSGMTPEKRAGTASVPEEDDRAVPVRSLGSAGRRRVAVSTCVRTPAVVLSHVRRELIWFDRSSPSIYVRGVGRSDDVDGRGVWPLRRVEYLVDLDKDGAHVRPLLYRTENRRNLVDAWVGIEIGRERSPVVVPCEEEIQGDNGVRVLAAKLVDSTDEVLTARSTSFRRYRG